MRKYSGPGHWNDPDMLEVGNGMSVSEDRAHFTLWSMLDAPLISGNDLRNMKPETLKILTDKDVIAINQDPLGIQALRYSAKDGMEVWFKPSIEGRLGHVRAEPKQGTAEGRLRLEQRKGHRTTFQTGMPSSTPSPTASAICGRSRISARPKPR